jgi:hypothetical protein
MNNYKKMNSYKSSFRNALMALLGGAMLCAACKKDDPKSAACEIVSFTVNGDEWNISGTNITHAYPAETAETSLTPAITLSAEATINPPANAAQNFFTEQGVTYTVTAEDGVAKKTYTVKAIVQAIDFGITGSCIWALTGEAGNYTLIISGNGATGDYGYGESPWYQYRDDIKTAVIQDGVTTIGDKAFYNCSGLTSVTIPNSVTTIGDEAYRSCRDLTSVTIPNSVTTISEMAFLDCHSLTDVTIGNSVTTIGDQAFYGCDGLTDITIPNSVTTIGDQAFYGCDGLTY